MSHDTRRVQLVERWAKEDIECNGIKMFKRKPKLGSIMKNESYTIEEFVERVVDMDGSTLKVKFLGFIPVSINMSQFEGLIKTTIKTNINMLIGLDIPGRKQK